MTETSPGLFTQNVLSEIIKIGSVLASIATILYLYGFGLTAKINMLLYVNFTDYLRVAIGWIAPAIGLSGLIGFFVPDFVSVLRPTKGVEPDANREFSTVDRRFKVYLTMLLIVPIVMISLAILFGLGLKYIFFLSTYVLIYVYLIALFWYLNLADLKKLLLLKNKINLICFCIPFLIFSIGSGLTHGLVDKSIYWKNRNFVIINTTNGTQLSGELLFNLDKFIVIRENDRTDITFLPSDRIILLRTPTSISSLKIGSSNKDAP